MRLYQKLLSAALICVLLLGVSAMAVETGYDDVRRAMQAEA